MLQYEYAREALKNGLILEQKLGINPYKFGMVGATDSHTSMSTSAEENFMASVAFRVGAESHAWFLIAGRSDFETLAG